MICSALSQQHFVQLVPGMMLISTTSLVSSLTDFFGQSLYLDQLSVPKMFTPEDTIGYYYLHKCETQYA